MEILESLLDGLRTVCACLPDARRSPDPNVDYSMVDIGLSAFSLFFMQSESFLSHQRRLEQGHGTSNCHTLFDMKKYVWSETEVEGERAFHDVLVQPPSNTGAFQNLPNRDLPRNGPSLIDPVHYADSAVIAYRLP